MPPSGCGCFGSDCCRGGCAARAAPRLGAAGHVVTASDPTSAGALLSHWELWRLTLSPQELPRWRLLLREHAQSALDQSLQKWVQSRKLGSQLWTRLWRRRQVRTEAQSAPEAPLRQRAQTRRRTSHRQSCPRIGRPCLLFAGPCCNIQPRGKRATKRKHTSVEVSVGVACKMNGRTNGYGDDIKCQELKRMRLKWPRA